MSDLKSQDIVYGERIGSGGTDAVLASYFRDILFKLSIDINRFQALLDRYIISRGIATNTAEISTSRSALRRELMSQTMTWKVFIKGLMFLKVERVSMEMILHREDAKTSLHEYTFEIKEQKEDDDSEEPNILADFFHEILTELDVDDDMFQYYLDTYVKFSKPGSSPVEQYTAKCSLRREILKNNISWKVLIKGLIFLQTHKVEFKLQLFHKNGRVSEHHKTLTFK